jgi:hypothetical protein
MDFIIYIDFKAYSFTTTKMDFNSKLSFILNYIIFNFIIKWVYFNCLIITRQLFIIIKIVSFLLVIIIIIDSVIIVIVAVK